MSKTPDRSSIASGDVDLATPSGARSPRRSGVSGRGPEPGMVVAGKYRLVELLKQGGMGSVWTATHLALDTLVAVKFIDRRLLGSEDSESSAASDTVALTRARFEREAKAAAQLRMSNVVQVFDYGVDEEMPYLVMELLRGEDLGARLRRVKRLTLAETSAVLGPVARALQIAHDMGLVHRDLKPANIFLAREGDVEVPKVLDFGIAKAVHGGDAATTSDSTTRGTIIGTPHYASPEQLTGKTRVDHRSDLWSLAVVAYRAITGKKPFDGKELLETVVDVCSAPIPTPTTIAPDLPLSVDAFFERALARDPDARFQSARALAAAFDAVASGAPPPAPRSEQQPEHAVALREPVSTPPEPPTTLWVPPPPAENAPTDVVPPDVIRRRRLVGLAAIAGSVIGVAIVALWVAGSARAPDDAAATLSSAAALEVSAPAVSREPDPPTPTSAEATTPTTGPTPEPAASPPSPSASSPRRAGRAPSGTAAPRKTKPQGEEVLGY